MKKGIEENELNIYENKKQFRHNAHYQADYSKMKDEILYEKFVTRGGLMQQSQKSLNPLNLKSPRSKSTLGNQMMVGMEIQHAY